MIDVVFEIASDEQSVGGFEMGNLTIRTPRKIVSSKTGGSPHLMMIFLSAVELLDGVRRFLSSKSTTYEFVGVDSSFAVRVKKLAKGKVGIYQGGEQFAQVKESELARAVYDGATCFYEAAKSKLSDEDPVVGDIEGALRKFKTFLA